MLPVVSQQTLGEVVSAEIDANESLKNVQRSNPLVAFYVNEFLKSLNTPTERGAVLIVFANVYAMLELEEDKRATVAAA